MESNNSVDITSLPLPRQERLRLWLRKQGLSAAAIARKLDLTTGLICRQLSAETIPTRRHAELVALGLPVALLPQPVDLKPGPRPRQSFPPAVGDLLPQPSDGRPGPKPRTVSPASASAATAQPATV